MSSLAKSSQVMSLQSWIELWPGGDGATLYFMLQTISVFPSFDMDGAVTVLWLAHEHGEVRICAEGSE